MVSLLIKLMLSSICGGIIGYERHKKNSNVGIRTYMTVCIGTTLVMIIAVKCFEDTNKSDITRLAAAAIQGVSFLGAGLIIHKDNRLEGLTTAAILWTTAIIGLAIGYGMYLEAILATMIFIIIGDFLLLFYKKEIEEYKSEHNEHHTKSDKHHNKEK